MGLADRSHRFVKTHDEAWSYLISLRPDLAFLQESFPPDGVAGEVVRDPFHKWGSLVFSPSLLIEPFDLPEGSALRALPNYLAFGEASFGDGVRAVLASVHAPPRRAEGDVLGGREPEELRRSVEGPKYNDAIFAGLVPLVEERRFIAAGDWNTARRQRTERDSRAGEQFFARVRDAGWCDCVWEELHDEIQTWFGGGKIQQDDYVFCDPELGKRVDKITVASDAVTEHGFSDHAPLIVDFAEATSAPSS
jgi:endonuclease/exonuclease/phosphatase family metal-dependent hydrolase